MNENAGNILALLFKDDFFICTIVNAAGDMVYKHIMPVDTTDKNSALESTFCAIDHLLGHSQNNAKAIGIGVPGVVNGDNTLSDIPSISGWEGLNLKEVIEMKYKISTFVENDVKLSTVGFYHNELKQQYNDVLYIFIGKGLGSGIIINQKLFKGFRCFSGELGYMVIEKPSEKEKQTIKAKGLLEQQVSRLLKNIKLAESESVKKAETKALVELMSYSILNLICVLNPEVIVLSGDIINEQFVNDLKVEVASLIDEKNSPQFMKDQSEMSGVYGIVNLCMSSISYKYQLVRGNGV
jgi:predicted NBD/HSP70 family sugar kinase